VATRLVSGLRAAGLDVWFDKSPLQMGPQHPARHQGMFTVHADDLAQSISEANRRRGFWREWMEADDFARGMGLDEPYIVPVLFMPEA
jgi:hypothetical protein